MAEARLKNRNDITGDKMTTGVPSEAYRNNWDAIFNKPKETEVSEPKETTDGDDSPN